MHTYIRLLSSRVGPEYRLTVIYTVSYNVNIIISLSIIKSGSHYPRHRVACIVIEQKSALEDVLSLVTVLPKFDIIYKG